MLRFSWKTFLVSIITCISLATVFSSSVFASAPTHSTKLSAHPNGSVSCSNSTLKLYTGQYQYGSVICFNASSMDNHGGWRYINLTDYCESWIFVCAATWNDLPGSFNWGTCHGYFWPGIDENGSPSYYYKQQGNFPSQSIALSGGNALSSLYISGC